MIDGISGMSNFEYAARFGVGNMKKTNPDMKLQDLVAEPEEDKNDLLKQLQKSMKEFQEEVLTGESDEDRKKMNDELRQYLADNGLNDKKLGDLTNKEIKDLNKFIKTLMKKYEVKRTAEDFGDFFIPKNDNALKYKYGGENKFEEDEEKTVFGII